MIALILTIVLLIKKEKNTQNKTDKTKTKQKILKQSYKDLFIWEVAIKYN